MIDKGKFNLLGVLVNAIDYDAVVEKVIKAAEAQQSLTVSALAVHGVMTGVLDKAQGFRLNHTDLVVPDGQPVRWALNWLYGCGLKERVYGPTLMLKMCDRAAELGLSIYLYGSTHEVLKALSQNLEEQFPSLKLAGVQPSLFRRVSLKEKSDRARSIEESGASIVFIGLGCPRQETWIYEHRELLNMPVLAIGAAFDFHAGSLKQAPAWMQRYGLEWVFRLIHEPSRLWKRYLYLNPLYIGLLVLQLLKFRAFKHRKASLSIDTMNYG